jgi:hypothetical protein
MSESMYLAESSLLTMPGGHCDSARPVGVSNYGRHMFLTKAAVRSPSSSVCEASPSKSPRHRVTMVY